MREALAARHQSNRKPLPELRRYLLRKVRDAVLVDDLLQREAPPQLCGPRSGQARGSGVAQHAGLATVRE